MSRPKLIILTILNFILIVLPIASRENYGVIDLGGSWKLKDYQIGEGVKEEVYKPGYDISDFINIRIPGTVRQALLSQEKIPHPYYGYNNEKSLWVESMEWWFCREFDVNKNLEGKYVRLDFDGINFKGDIWLNGKKLGEVKGMFNPYSFKVSDLLNYGMNNTIVVRLQAPDDATEVVKIHGLTYTNRRPGRNQLHSIAQCFYGWDWGPHQMPIGIWKDVILNYSGPIRIKEPYIKTSIESNDLAILNISCTVENLSDEEKEVELAGSVEGKGFDAGNIKIKESQKLKAGESKKVRLNVKVNNPKLWWPNGMGDQNLYIFRAEVSTQGKISDAIDEQFGIRELEMVENEGVEEFIKKMEEEEGLGSQYRLGKVVGSYPWTFKVNGKKMFAKGANWIPIDQMLRVDRNRYEHLIKLAKKANMNLFRVWGGGLYETDDFYELCDEYGIMAWQDFLSNRDISEIDRKSFFEGAIAATIRIRNHPSLTFYCGGNEFDPDNVGSKFVVDSLENILKNLDPSREFHRASPYMGDDHYWGVWHGMEPYTNYRVVRPFRSEAGINTFPVAENYKRFTPEEYQWPLDKLYIEYHGERNPTFYHFFKLQRYSDEFGPSTSIEEFIMKSQLYQAIGNKFNMEFCRANKFKNSGLLYWQYNDIWPVISWAFVDWYGTPKPCYYWVASASRPIHISADYEKYVWKPGEEFNADIYLLNDSYENTELLTYEAKLFDVSGKVIQKINGRASAEANSSKKIDNISRNIHTKAHGKSMILSVRVFDSSGLISESVYPIACEDILKAEGHDIELSDWDRYYSIFREMNEMPEVKLSVNLSKKSVNINDDTNKLTMELKNPTDNLAFFTGIKLDQLPDEIFAFYSDNYFTLQPNDVRKVEIELQNIGGVSESRKANFVIYGWNVEEKKIPLMIEVK